MQYPTIAQPQYAFAPTMPMMAEGGLVPAARAVQSKGRNGDSMLVHMTPGEVGGLQALAMQHGGSLSINPQTGLPEANFLKNLLPTLLGVGLSFIPGVGPLAAGMITGGIETVRTGDIGKGFMAGLGAYGGANLAGSLTSAGAQGAQQTAMAKAAAEQATNQSIASGIPTVGSDTGVMGFLPGSEGGVNQIMNAYTQNVPQTIAERATAAGQGFTNLGTEAGRTAFMDQAGGITGLAKTAGMAGAPILADALTPKPFETPPVTEEKSNYEGPYTPTKREVRYPTDEERRRTSEFMYFNPSNPVPFAEGGESKASPDVFVSPNEAKVYQDILNVQRLAGLPALDPSRFAVMPGRSYEQFVYNPIDTAPASTAVKTGETNYGFKPLMSKAEIEAAEAARKAEEEAKKNSGSGRISGIFGNRIGAMFGDSDNPVIGYTASGEKIYQNRFAKGGVPMLEDGGFVLTKKAVDGLGKGSNKKGQKAASRGLGAIPIKGPGTGTSDSIKTSIEGKRPARVSNGEAYVPKKQVAKHGGAKKFYALMKKAERRA